MILFLSYLFILLVSSTRPNIPLSFSADQSPSFKVYESDSNANEDPGLVHNLQAAIIAGDQKVVEEVSTKEPEFLWVEYSDELFQRNYAARLVDFAQKGTVSHIIISNNIELTLPSRSSIFTQLIARLPENIGLKFCPFLGTATARDAFARMSPLGDALEGIFVYVTRWNAGVAHLSNWGKRARLGIAHNVFTSIVLDLGQFTQDEIFLHYKDIAKLKDVYGITELSVVTTLSDPILFEHYMRIGIDKFYVRDPKKSKLFAKHGHLIYPLWSSASSFLPMAAQQGRYYT